MKKLIIGLSLLFIFASVANAAKILEYKFNDPSATRAVDTSGNGLNGTFKAMTITAYNLCCVIEAQPAAET